MIKKILIALLLTCSMTLANAQTNDTVQQAPPANLSSPLIVDEVVAVVGNKMILLSDLHTQQALWKQQRQIRPDAKLSQQEQLQIFEQLLIQKLLAIGAIADSLPTNDIGIVGNVENRINQLSMQLGSVRELEKLFNAPIYQIRDMLMYQSVEEGLANAMRGEVLKNVTTTPLTVKEYAKKYEDEIQDIMPRQVSYAHIVALPPTDYDAKMKVKEELMEIRKKIIDGSSFSAMARLYSEDTASATRGGEMDFSPLNVWESEFADAIRTLKPGGISGVIETRYGFHIIELMEQKGELYKVRHILLSTKLDADQINRAAIKLDSVANEIRLGNITFEEAALKYSDDEATKNNGGLVLNIERSMSQGVSGYTDKFYEDELRYDAQSILNLKKGEVSNAFISYDNMSRKEVCKIVTLIEDYPSHRANVKDDYNFFEQLAIEAYKSEVMDKWVEESIDNVYIQINPPYDQSKFHFNWQKRK